MLNDRSKRILALILGTVFLFPAFAGCVKTPAKTDLKPSSQTPSQSETTKESEIQPPVTAYGGSEEYAAMTDIELSRRAGAEGMILLKNDNNALPIAKGATVALFGGGQIDFIKGGTGSGDVNALYTVNLLEGMRAKEAEGKVRLYADLVEHYEKNKNYFPTDKVFAAAAEAAEYAVIVITRNSGENVDLDASQFNLGTGERTMLRKVAEAGFKHVSVVLNVGTVMDTTGILQVEGIDGLLVCWQPGMEGGNSTADVLCGDINPSGKTADTWAVNYGAYPSSKNFAGPEYAVYSEDIYVGYRYFETFDPEYKKVNFPFGYGLSYTTFEFSDASVRENDDNIEASVTVTNTGAVAGKEVAQVYYAAPAGKLGAPGKVLAAFEKTKLLEPGESQKLTMTFAISDMAMYDDVGKIAKSAYLLEAGDYKIFIGNSIKNAGERGEVFTHKESADRVVAQLDGRISATTLDERLTADGSYEKLDTSFGYGVTLGAGRTVFSACDYRVQYTQALLAANDDGSVFGMSLGSGDTLYYLLNVPKEGEYVLTLGCGTGEATTRSKLITVETGGQKYTFDVKGTGSKFSVAQTDGVTVKLKEGANDLKLSVSSGFSSSLLLSTLTLDDGSGAGETNLVTYEKQSKKARSDEKIDFKEVWADPSKMEAFLDTLTPEEMISLLVGHAAHVGRGDGSLAGLTSKGVPYLDTSDGPAGLDLAVKQVAWPIETALASTWDVQLLYAVGAKIGEECVKAGVDVWLAPGVNIHRDPLGGRNFEYFSEDPLITGKMASAITQGVQSSKGAGVMIKHLYANSREYGRVDGNSSISERAARMIYLRGFEICIREASPYAVMTTYTTANGVYNAENGALLNGVLRGEWGFEGFICTDWGSHSDQFREIAAGNDAKMSWGYPESCLDAYKCGYITYDALRASAKRILQISLNSVSMNAIVNPTIIVHEVNGTTRIKASELSTRSEGVNLEECTDEDGGVNPNYCQDGREITYNLDVKKAGTYALTVRAASNNTNSSFILYLDGKRVGRYLWKKGSGGWQAWETLETPLEVNLKSGEHVLRFVFGAALNINWFELTEVTEE